MHLVMFDIDGTLIHSNKADTKCYRAALAAFGIHEVNEDIATYAHVTDASITHEILTEHHQRPAQPEDLQVFLQHYLQLLSNEAAENPDGFRPVPGAMQAFHTLCQRRDTAVALATGAWKPTAHLKLTSSGFNIDDIDSIPFASSSDAVSRETIMRLAYERARQRHGCSIFDSITYIGDGVWDVRACRLLRYYFIGICAGKQPDKLQQEGARIILEDYRDLNQFLAVLQSVQSGITRSFHPIT